MPTKFVLANQIPPTGVPCPVCEEGTISESKYGIWCPTCKTNWRITKYLPIQASQPISHSPSQSISRSPIQPNTLLLQDIKRLLQEISNSVKPLQAKEETIPVIEEEPPPEFGGK